jgi:hypothetical protein
MSHIIQRRHWFHTVVLSEQAPKEAKTGDVNDSFYKELECVLKKKKKKNSAALSPRANYTN